MEAEGPTACVRLSPAAQRDLDDVFRYSARLWGMGQAVRYVQAIRDACVHWASTPTSAQDCRHIREGYRRGLVGRHWVYFRGEVKGIAVVRILHQRMDAARHL